MVWLAMSVLFGAQGDSSTRAVLWTTGNWSLYFLCITLTITPLRRLTGWDWLKIFRRLPGMYAFFYGCLHLGAYLWLRRSGDLIDVLVRILTRSTLLTGFLALAIMAVLAVTSTQESFMRLGVRRWQGLHCLIYPCAGLVVLHYWLEVSRYGSNRPLWFGGLVAVLLVFRVLWWWLNRHTPREHF